MKISLISIFTSLTLIGCASQSPFPNNHAPKMTEVEYPQIGTVATASIAEEMIRKGSVVTRSVLSLPTAVTFDRVIIIGQGYYPMMGEDQDNEYFSGTYILGSDGAGVVSFLDKSFERYFRGIVVPKGRQEVCLSVLGGKAQACRPAVGLSRTTVNTYNNTNFQQTLIYNGRVGSKINIGYREFYDDRARPAFSNSVEYDLTDSKIISYREVQIEIIEASNQKIIYRVHRSFGRPK